MNADERGFDENSSAFINVHLRFLFIVMVNSK